MASVWSVRAVRSEDAEQISTHRYWRGESQEDLAAYAHWLPERIERGAYVGFVAEVAGHVIGGAGAVLLDWGPTRGEASATRARIVNVFTAPEWRKQGIASGLVRHIVTACAERRIRVFSLAASPEGANMYASLGFVPYPEEMILRLR